MSRSDHGMAIGVNQLGFLFRRLAPQNKHEPLSSLVQLDNHVIGKLFPATFAMRVCLAAANRQNRIEEKHALLSPGSQIARGWQAIPIPPQIRSKLLKDILE